MDPSQPQPEPITATAVAPPRPTTEPTTHHSPPSAKRGRGRPLKKQAQLRESKPVVLGLSEAMFAKMEDARREKLNRRRPFKKENVAGGWTPLPPKKRHERLLKVSAVQSAAPDAHRAAPTKSELTANGGRAGKLPVKRRGRPAGSGEPKKNVSQVVVDADAAPQSTMVNLDCQVLQKKMEMEIMRLRIKEAVGVLKPYIFTAENPSSSAMAAILELERIAADSGPPPLIDLNLHPDS